VSNCRSCGEAIVWIKTQKGKSMPCNTEKITIVTEDGQVVTGRTSHFATCPQAGQWRKDKKGQ